jgi:hypothetical protein
MACLHSTRSHKLDLKSNLKPLGLVQSGHAETELSRSKSPKLKPMIWYQIYDFRLKVAKHETQTWHAYIQPESINLTSNQTLDPKANRPRIRGLLQINPSTSNAKTHPETTPFKHNQNVGAQAMRPRIPGLLQVGLSPPQMTTCNHAKPIPNLQTLYPIWNDTAAMRPRILGGLQVGLSPPQMTTCNHPRPIPNLQTL